MKLTEKQEKFVQELIKGKSQREAYKLAGYKSDNASDKTIDEAASRLLKNSKVLARYNELRSRLIKEAEDECIVTAKDVLREYAKIGFSNISDYLKVNTSEKVVEYDTDEEGRKIPIREWVQSVELFDTDEIDREKMDAVAEIKQTRDGIALKLHDKKGALDSIARHLGMFNDNINIGNKDDKPFETKNSTDLSKLSVGELKQLESILSKTTDT